MIRLLFFVCLLSSSLGASASPITQPERYQLSIAAIFHNESRFLEEWLLFHLCQGVDHFYLFDNGSKDDYESVLRPYIDKGIVELHAWPAQGSSHAEWKRIQWSCYDQALKLARGQSHWLALIDTDEFVFATKSGSLREALRDYEAHGGVVIYWQCYGTSHVRELQPSQFLVEEMSWCARKDHPMNRWYKTIAQPKRVARAKDAHSVEYKKGYHAVYDDGSRAKKPEEAHMLPVRISKLRINHYWSRDEKFVAEEKRGRYLLWSDELHVQLESKLKGLQARQDPLLYPYGEKMRCYKEKLFGKALSVEPIVR